MKLPFPPLLKNIKEIYREEKGYTSTRECLGVGFLFISQTKQKWFLLGEIKSFPFHSQQYKKMERKNTEAYLGNGKG